MPRMCDVMSAIKMHSPEKSLASMSIRGLDKKVMDRLKQRAQRERTSVNSVVVRLLQNATGKPARQGALQKFDDLDALVGTWDGRQERVFLRNTEPFSEVDPALWK
jgi:antitoxin FitA-like protein